MMMMMIMVIVIMLLVLVIEVVIIILKGNTSRSGSCGVYDKGNYCDFSGDAGGSDAHLRAAY